MQVTVKAVKKDNTAFCDTDEKWHNMGYKQTLPPGVTPGSVVEIEEKTNAKGFTNITTIKLVDGGTVGDYVTPPAPTKGSKFSRDELIVRQNALSNAVNFVKGEATPEYVLEVMEIFADGVFNGKKPIFASSPVKTNIDHIPY